MTQMSPAPARRVRNPRGEGGRLRDELLTAANALLQEGGTEEGLSLRAVTRRAGVTPQAFYLHFADRDELLWEVYAAAFGRLEAALAAAEADASTPAAQLRGRCLAYCRFAEADPASYLVCFGVAGEYKPDWVGGELPSAVSYGAWLGAVTRCVDAGQARATNPVPLTLTLLGAIHGLVMLRLNKPMFPWPTLHDLVDDVLVHQVGLPAAG